MCKPNKMNGWNKRTQLGHTGYGNVKQEIISDLNLKEYDDRAT